MPPKLMASAKINWSGCKIASAASRKINELASRCKNSGYQLRRNAAAPYESAKPRQPLIVLMAKLDRIEDTPGRRDRQLRWTWSNSSMSRAAMRRM